MQFILYKVYFNKADFVLFFNDTPLEESEYRNKDYSDCLQGVKPLP